MYTVLGLKCKEMGSFYEVNRNSHAVGKIQEEVEQTVWHKENIGCPKNITDQVHSSLGTHNQRPMWLGELECSGSEATPPQRPWLQTITSSPKHIPGFKEGADFALYLRALGKAAKG